MISILIHPHLDVEVADRIQGGGTRTLLELRAPTTDDGTTELQLLGFGEAQTGQRVLVHGLDSSHGPEPSSCPRPSDFVAEWRRRSNPAVLRHRCIILKGTAPIARSLRRRRARVARGARRGAGAWPIEPVLGLFLEGARCASGERSTPQFARAIRCWGIGSTPEASARGAVTMRLTGFANDEGGLRCG